ncbi:MAG: hypothetical protein Q8Q48_00595 [Candidatus Staskawiczbacteria bacterium]|nr:hypothetical protein [Candidatus Staskawiczbacteria bacterium]
MDFLQKISALEPSKHVFKDSRGSEENAKVKFIVPLLEYLGYDVVRDMYFELFGIDIALRVNNANALVVECKSWGELLDDYKSQFLEYAYKMRTPFVLASSGEHTALYSALLNSHDLNDTEPIIEFRFSELSGEQGTRILSALHGLISKESYAKGFPLLYEDIEKRLQTQGITIEQSKKAFLEAATGFEPSIKMQRITEETFTALARTHEPEVAEALELLRKEMDNLVHETRNAHVRFRSKEIGIAYTDKSGPRTKIVGLFGVYPESARIAYGLDGWKKALKVSDETYQELALFPRDVTGKESARALIQLLRKALSEIKE